MADKSPKIMGSGCLGGLIGAFFGVVLGLGGFIGAFIGSVDLGSSHPVEVPKGAGDAETVPYFGLRLFDTCGVFFGMLLGAGIGGMLGGIGGSVLGAGLAAKVSSTHTEEFPSVNRSRPAKGKIRRW